MKDSQILEELRNFNVKNLKSVCKELNISSNGNKKQLIQRLLKPLALNFKMNGETKGRNSFLQECTNQIDRIFNTEAEAFRHRCHFLIRTFEHLNTFDLVYKETMDGSLWVFCKQVNLSFLQTLEPQSDDNGSSVDDLHPEMSLFSTNLIEFSEKTSDTPSEESSLGPQVWCEELFYMTFNDLKKVTSNAIAAGSNTYTPFLEYFDLFVTNIFSDYRIPMPEYTPSPRFDIVKRFLDMKAYKSLLATSTEFRKKMKNSIINKAKKIWLPHSNGALLSEGNLKTADSDALREAKVIQFNERLGDTFREFLMSEEGKEYDELQEMFDYLLIFVLLANGFEYVDIICNLSYVREEPPMPQGKFKNIKLRQEIYKIPNYNDTPRQNTESYTHHNPVVKRQSHI